MLPAATFDESWVPSLAKGKDRGMPERCPKPEVYGWNSRLRALMTTHHREIGGVEIKFGLNDRLSNGVRDAATRLEP